MIAVDLFAGAGGMSLGAQSAGIDVSLAVENNPHAARTYRYNHKSQNTYVFEDDIRILGREQMSHLELLPEQRASAMIVFGGPPCRGFSSSNQRTRNDSNPDNWLFEEYLRVVSILEPEWVVFENVRGLTETQGGKFLSKIIDGFSNLGYTCSYRMLNAAEYGVPQRRWRLFIVCHSFGIQFDFNKISISEPITVSDAIRDLPVLSNGASKEEMPYGPDEPSPYARSLRGDLKTSQNHCVTNSAKHIIERYSHVPPGGNWRNIPEELMSSYKDRSRCHSGIYRRLDPNSPATVIGNFRKNMLIHPSENRGLSVREAARLQSFPDHFVFQGTVGLQQQQVGNAVPPLLAEQLFSTVLSLS